MEKAGSCCTALGLRFRLLEREWEQNRDESRGLIDGVSPLLLSQQSQSAFAAALCAPRNFSCSSRVSGASPPLTTRSTNLCERLAGALRRYLSGGFCSVDILLTKKFTSHETIPRASAAQHVLTFLPSLSPSRFRKVSFAHAT